MAAFDTDGVAETTLAGRLLDRLKLDFGAQMGVGAESPAGQR